ncbi:MAG: transposase family protein [Candidatus Eremiobacteraeota bacterium]|nr:transposase family protein [Candidatus Eremiobacteraeota bacterium]
MKNKKFLTSALGIKKPWEIQSFVFNEKERRLDVFLQYHLGGMISCPTCGLENCKAYNTDENEDWRHLDMFEHPTFIHAKLPKVMCDNCGIVTLHAHKEEKSVRDYLKDCQEQLKKYTAMGERTLVEIYSVATMPVHQAMDLIVGAWNGLTGLVVPRAKRNWGGVKDWTQSKVREARNNPFIDKIFPIEDLGFHKPKVYTPKNSPNNNLPGGQINILVEGKDLSATFTKSARKSNAIPPQLEQKPDINFDLEDWKVKLGIDVEKLRLSVKFRVLIIEEPLNQLLGHFEELYNNVLHLLYSGENKPTSALLQCEGRKDNKKDVISIIVYEGNEKVIKEMYSIIRAKTDRDSDEYLDLFVRYVEDNVDIDPEIFESALKTAESFMKFINTTSSFKNICLDSNFGSVEILNKP